MEVADIPERVSAWTARLGNVWPAFEPFAELAAIRAWQLVVSPDSYALYRPGSIAEPLSEANRVAHDTNMEAICRQLPRRASVIIAVDRSCCLFLDRQIPRSARRRAGQILALELARSTPFTAEEVLTGWYEGADSGSNDRIDIVQAIIRRDLLAAALAALKARNAKIEGVTVRNGVAPALPLAISPDGAPFGRARLRRAQTMLAAGIIVLAIGLAAGSAVLLDRQAQLADRIAAQTAIVAKEAALVRDRLAARKQAADGIASLALRQRASPDPVVIIEELTRLLPDDVFLQGLAITRDQIVVDGMAKAPEPLIAAIEASSLFGNVSFLSPVIRNPNEARSHFSIRMEPETVQTLAGTP